MKRAAVATALGLVLITLARAEVDCQLTPGGLCYRAEGSGPVVVLIHGFQMDLREWDEVAPIVAKSHRVVRYDLRGHGRSTVTDPLPSTSVDLLALLDSLGIDRATLVGMSMGSTVAIDFALTHPHRVDRLVILSPGVPGLKVAAPLDWMQPIMEAVKRGDPRRAAELWWESPLLAGVRQSASAVRYRPVVLDNARVWTLPNRPPPLQPPAGTRLSELEVPMLVVAGELDRSGSLDVARILEREVTGARLVVLPQAWHMLSLERPDDVARFILGKDQGSRDNLSGAAPRQAGRAAVARRVSIRGSRRRMTDARVPGDR